ncbi:RNA-binding protein S1 [Clostridia bacterium]|nr:RNA-binding protein S1 [Clostridia bacterium]
MAIGVGEILEGKVSGITKFAAFVSLEENRSGMVHISEIAFSFVNDIHEHLQEGQIVKVKVIGIDPEGRINLSIKKAADPPPREDRRPYNNNAPRYASNRRPAAPAEPANFEDRLKLFMQQSETKMSDLRHNEKKVSRRKGH